MTSPRTATGRRTLGAALISAVALAGLSAAAAPAAERGVVTFGYTGEEERFVVPAGVTSIGVVAAGAPGERGEDNIAVGAPGGPGGLGARVATSLAVTPGQVLFVRVGGPGVAGGFNGGGPGGTGLEFFRAFGGDGGGATDLRTCPAAATVCPDGSPSSAASRLVVAGGGGGGGGGAGDLRLLSGGAGGSALSGSGVGGDGSVGELVQFAGDGGTGGREDGPGSGGIGRNGSPGGAGGSGGDGGAGGSGGTNPGHGGGGGGGWFGAGGGGAGFGGGGGGAGSSHGPAGTLYAINTSGVPSLSLHFAPPEVVTGAATTVTRSTATLTGRVNPQAQDTTWWFEYGTDTSYGRVGPLTAGDAGRGTDGTTVQAALDDLDPGTTYHFRLVAENAAGTGAGIDRTFTTPPADPVVPMLAPAVTTGAASAVTSTTATVGAIVNPRGRDTDWVIEYGETTGEVRTLALPAAGAGTDPVAVSVPLTGLAPATTHWYRVVATNEAGIGEGIFRSFATRPASAAPARPVPPVGAGSARAGALRLSITAPAARPRVGRPFGLRVRVANRGAAPARGVRTRVVLPRSLRVVAVGAGCLIRGRVATCVNRGALAPGRQRTFVLRVRPSARGAVAVGATVGAATHRPGASSARLPLRIAG